MFEQRVELSATQLIDLREQLLFSDRHPQARVLSACR